MLRQTTRCSGQKFPVLFLFYSDCLCVADVILAVTFLLDGLVWHGAATLLLVLAPNAIVQVFSARWNKIDGLYSRPVVGLHALLLGSLHRSAVISRNISPQNWNSL